MESAGPSPASSDSRRGLGSRGRAVRHFPRPRSISQPQQVPPHLLLSAAGPGLSTECHTLATGPATIKGPWQQQDPCGPYSPTLCTPTQGAF